MHETVYASHLFLELLTGSLVVPNNKKSCASKNYSYLLNKFKSPKQQWWRESVYFMQTKYQEAHWRETTK